MKKVSANVFKVKSPKAAFYTIDNSVSLIRYLKKNEHKLSQVPIKQVNASVDALPFQDNFFDVVYSVSVLWYVENVIRAIDEMYRVLKPGGIMCFDVMSILNPTGFLGTISNFLTKNIVLKYSMNYVIPAAIERHVKKLGGSYESYGFMPILPTALPVVGDRLNVYMWLNWLPEVKNSLIKNVCNKVIYKVKKPDNNEKRP
jgi:ubiquinone/menaquinone biosynthesis C-methylase UbiE